MRDLSQLAIYVIAALLLAVTPGPGIFYVAARWPAGVLKARLRVSGPT